MQEITTNLDNVVVSVVEAMMRTRYWMAHTASKKRWTLMMVMTEEDKAEVYTATTLSAVGTMDAALATAEMMVEVEIEAADTGERPILNPHLAIHS